MIRHIGHNCMFMYLDTPTLNSTMYNNLISAYIMKQYQHHWATYEIIYPIYILSGMNDTKSVMATGFRIM